MQMWGSGLFELQHIEADYQLQSSEIGHFITLSGRRVFEFYSELADFYFFIFGTGHKGQICNLQWFLAKCCFHLKFSSDSEHMDHVSWMVLNPFKMLFSSHISLIVLCCLMSDPSGKTTIIHGYYFHNSRKKQTHQLYIGCEKPVGNKKSERIWWEEATTASRDFCPAKIKIDSKLKTNTSVILRNFNQHRFIPNFKHLVEAGWFFKCSGLSTVMIQMRCGHPCDSDDRDPCFGAACLFELPWVSEGIPPCLNGPTDHWPQPTPFYPWTQITKHFSQKFWRDVADKRRRRWMPVKSPSPILTSLLGNWGLPRPRIHAWPKHRRYSRHTTRQPGSFLDCDSGFWWRYMTQQGLELRNVESGSNGLRAKEEVGWATKAHHHLL